MLRAGFLSALLLLLQGCASLFFHPLERSHQQTPRELGLAYEDVNFHAPDGVRLHGWFLPARESASATVLFLHGNTDDIGSHLGHVAWMPAAGLNVFLFDYRGYGASEGRPRLAGLFADIESALRTLVLRSDIDRQRIIVYGQSMGGAMAVHALRHSSYREHVRGLVIDGAFASYRLIARDATKGVPFARLFTRTTPDDFSPLKSIAEISPTPLLIIHSQEDAVVPVHHAERLYAAARAPKSLWILPEGEHILTFKDPENRKRWLHYASSLLPPSAPARYSGPRPVLIGADGDG